MALGHIAPGAITMPKKYQKYVQTIIPNNLVYIYIYIYIYIWIYLAIFWYFFGMVTSPKKYKNITKYIQIYTRYTRYIQNTRPPPGRRLVFCICLVYLVYICIYLVIFWYFVWCRNQFFSIGHLYKPI